MRQQYALFGICGVKNLDWPIRRIARIAGLMRRVSNFDGRSVRSQRDSANGMNPNNSFREEGMTDIL